MFTKGDWTYNGKYIDSTDGTRIAEIYNHAPNYIANAHLICQAPKLYEACKSALKLFKEQYEIVLGAYPKYGEWEEIKKLEQAIAPVEEK